jgi:hypothetical protein
MTPVMPTAHDTELNTLARVLAIERTLPHGHAVRCCVPYLVVSG